jgi:sucrose phosphorylase
MLDLAGAAQERGGNVNRILSAVHAGGVDVHQLNGTYYSMLHEDDDRYVAARAIQLFAPGVPQVYYVGLLAGVNDQGALARTGDGRAINRHNFDHEEVTAALARPVVGRIVELVRLRNMHPAFAGELCVDVASDHAFGLRWEHPEGDVGLELDFARGRATMAQDGRAEAIAEWRT